jgi:NDP-sugar pyrophosphorylase family protein
MPPKQPSSSSSSFRLAPAATTTTAAAAATGTTSTTMSSSSSSSATEFVAVVLASSIGTRLYPITTDEPQQQQQQQQQRHEINDDQSYVPKHMLPIVGIPILLRLLHCIEQCQFTECVIALKHDDTVTRSLFTTTNNTLQYTHPYKVVATPKQPRQHNPQQELQDQPSLPPLIVQSSQMKITIINYETPCTGTIDALRQLDPYVPNINSHCVLFPSDLLVFDIEPIRTMIHTHRCNQQNKNYNYNHSSSSPLSLLHHSPFSPVSKQSGSRSDFDPIHQVQQQGMMTHPTTLTSNSNNYRSCGNHVDDNADDDVVVPSCACTVLLVDVTAFDEPTSSSSSSLATPILKESAKQKKSLLFRDVEEIDYIAISETIPQPQHPSSSYSNKQHNNHISHTTQRLIWKQSKLDVEEDKDQVGTTPKVKIPKFRVLSANRSNSHNTKHNNCMTRTRISTEWDDVHCYCISPWVRRLIQIKRSTPTFQSIQYDLIPLLIGRQYRGIVATFGSKLSYPIICETLQECYPLRNQISPLKRAGLSQQPSRVTSKISTTSPSVVGSTATSSIIPVDHDDNTTVDLTEGKTTMIRSKHNALLSPSHGNDEYTVLAQIVLSKTSASVTPTLFRSHTISSYLFANRIMTHELSAINVIQQQQQQSSSITNTTNGNHTNNIGTNPLLFVPDGASIKSKFHTIVLSDCTIAEKVTFKSCVIGRHCTIGKNCRLNNVILHDHVQIGDNTTLQNTIIAAHVTIGENCNFNDCQILHHMNIPSNTKKKGEAITTMDYN